MRPIRVTLTSTIPTITGTYEASAEVVATILPALKGDKGDPGPGVANAGQFAIHALDGTVINDRIVTGDPVL